MELHAQLLAVVRDATSASGALSAAARVIAEAFGAEACSIVVRRDRDDLQIRAHHGPPPDAATSVAVTMLAEATLLDILPRRGPASGAVLVAVPVAAINQAIGAIVLRRPASGSAFTSEETMRLSGAASEVVGVIESVRLVESIEGRERPGESSELVAPTGECVLRGIAASSGIAVGAVRVRNALPKALVHREAAYAGATSESARVRDASQKTWNDLLRLQSAAAGEIGEEQSLIFGAHLLLLHDPVLTRLIEEGIAAGHPAPAAIDLAFDESVQRLREVTDPYLQERVEDLEDLRMRLLGHVLGVERQGAVDTNIVLCTRMTPSLVVELKAGGARGVVSELGGATSHGALLARSLGVPAVTGIGAAARDFRVGDPVVVDGDEGVVVVRPTAETRAGYERRSEQAERRRTEFLKYRHEPGRTADGVRVDVQANIALGSDLEIARENGAAGIGLYRTEFPFIVRDAIPTVQEQTQIYAKAYQAFPSAPVTFRLLDLAGDKFIAGRGLGGSRNAFHGYRSIRILFDYPHILRDQVQAFAAAAAGRELRILIPMVTSVEEIVRVKQLVAAALAEVPEACTGALAYGAMVETPAAAELIEDLAEHVDFFSLGTNDLIQYVLVADREDPRLSSERDAYHPAILRIIRRVVMQAHGEGKLVTVCGEMAARPDLAMVLIALGADALSVTPRRIPELKQALARMFLRPIRESLDDLLASSTREAVESALRRHAAAADVPGTGETRHVDPSAR